MRRRGDFFGVRRPAVSRATPLHPKPSHTRQKTASGSLMAGQADACPLFSARVQDSLRKWGTGGFLRPEKDKPFGDAIASAPTRKAERELAPHPSLKPQAFLRQLVRAVLPLGTCVLSEILHHFYIFSTLTLTAWPLRSHASPSTVPKVKRSHSVSVLA